MNITQKRIIGWALVIIGVAMVMGAIIDAWEWASNQLGHLLISPFFYLGLIMGVAGVVVLIRDEKFISAIRANRKVAGWFLVLLGAAISIARFIHSLKPVKHSIIYSWTRGHDFFMRCFLNPIFYGGIVLIVVGLLVIKGRKTSRIENAPSRR